METEAKITALLALLAVLLLAHTLQPPRFRCHAAATLITDLLLSTLEFDGRRLVDLVTRRNMILLCHAILLIILKDAGLLATPARRCAATTSTSTSTASASAAAGEGACSRARPQERSIVVWRNKAAKSATIADGGRLKRERRGPRPAKVKARRALLLTEAAATDREEAVVQELALVEGQRSDCLNLDHVAVRLREIVPVEDKSSFFYSEQIADDEDINRGEEEMAREKTEDNCGDDVDEMNRRFEEFITNTRRKMHLESLQLVKV